MDNQQEPIPPVVEQKEQAPNPPYLDVLIEDMVSHVEAVPNCNEPVFETVPLMGCLCVRVCVIWDVNSALRVI